MPKNSNQQLIEYKNNLTKLKICQEGEFNVMSEAIFNEEIKDNIKNTAILDYKQKIIPNFSRKIFLDLKLDNRFAQARFFSSLAKEITKIECKHENNLAISKRISYNADDSEGFNIITKEKSLLEITTRNENCIVVAILYKIINIGGAKFATFSLETL